MKTTRTVLALLLYFIASNINGQTRIDGNFPFQTEPAKQYSIFIPSGYQPGIEHRMMLGFHPANTSRWTSTSWCDTLAAFAESNQIILVCPDGGPDGRIDGAIDTAFTTALLDSMITWYSIDQQKTYAMGFSIGGLVTYTYGLSNASRFGGFIPIGPAVNGTNEVTGIIQNATGKPFFLVHGIQDSPNTRFYPMRTALIANNAIEKDTLINGVGHTIDFPNRNNILSMAFQWIDSVNCANIINNIPPQENLKNIFLAYPTILHSDGEINIMPGIKAGVSFQLELYDIGFRKAKEVEVSEAKELNTIKDLFTGLVGGTYFLVLKSEGAYHGTQKIILQ